MENKAILYLIPTPIGNLSDITERSLETLRKVDLILCEDTRETSKLLQFYGIQNKLVSCHEYNEEKVKTKVLEYLNSGLNVGLVTDQGTPLISDPGYKIVDYIVEHHFSVVSLPGATAFVPALTISGLPPQPFLFYGFLSSKEFQQKKELQSLQYFPYTMIFYEAPHRIMKTLLCMQQVLGDRRICIVREISKKFETAYYGTFSTVMKELTLKGEFVIVVDGDHKKQSFDNLSIVEHVELYKNDGITTNEAIKIVAKERNLSKAVVYQEYHQLKDTDK